jgi:drug/metabolite transporter (DMT)-like permease
MSKTTTHSFEPISFGAIALGVFTAFLWALWPVISRYSILQSMSATDITVVRFWVAGLVMLPYLFKHGLGGLSWLALLFFACSAGVAYVSFALTGLEYAPAAHGGMIIPSSTMVFAAIGGWLVLGEKPNAQRILGMLMIGAGIALTAGSAISNNNQGDASSTLWVGHLLFLTAGMCWGSFTVAAQKTNLSALHIAAIVSVFAMLLVTPPYLLFSVVLGDGGLFNAPIKEVAIQGIFQGLIIAVLALFTYAKTIKMLGSARGSLFVALVPGIAPILAFLILGEQLSSLEILSLIVITIGMVVALRAK